MRFLICSLALGAATPSPGDDLKEKTNAEKLVGTWTLAKGGVDIPDGIGVSVEFTKDGKMTVRFAPKEKGEEPVALTGTYKVEKGKLDYTLDDGEGGKKQELLTIDKLTADELVTTDPKGIKEEFKRQKVEEKKDKK